MYLRSFKMENILPMLKYHANYWIWNPIDARWIDDWYNHMIKENKMIVRGFNSISEAVQNAEDIYEKKLRIHLANIVVDIYNFSWQHKT